MNIKAIRTDIIRASQMSLEEMLDKFLPEVPERSILAITSKVVALCEGNIEPANTPLTELIEREADWLLPENLRNKYIALTIKDGTLIPAAGIDKSNAGGDYVLWPQDARASANQIRAFLKNKYDLQEVGVIIADSGAMPLRFGTLGIVVAYSGFNPFREYKGQADLFGQPLNAGKANLAGGLAAAAVTAMGEGTEQTPLALINDVSAVRFEQQGPSDEQWQAYFIAPDKERMFEAFFKGIDWQTGGHKKH